MAAKTTPTPKQATVQPTLEHWLLSEANTNWLKQLLADPRFAAVCHYAADLHRVTSEDLVGPRAALPEVVVRKAALYAGAVEFVLTLKKLPTMKPPVKTTQFEAWEHINPETR